MAVSLTTSTLSRASSPALQAVVHAPTPSLASDTTTSLSRSNKTVSLATPTTAPSAMLASGSIQPSAIQETGIFGSIGHAIKDVAAVALAPVTGGASLAATKDTRTAVAATAKAVTSAPARDIFSVLAAPVTGGASLAAAPQVPKAIVKGAEITGRAIATPAGLAITSSVVGIGLAPFTGGISLAIPAVGTTVAGVLAKKQASKNQATQAAAYAATGSSTTGYGTTQAYPGAVAQTSTHTLLLYGGLALVGVLLLRELA